MTVLRSADKIILFRPLCLCVFLLIIPAFVFSQSAGEVDIEEARQKILGEAPEEIMGFSLGDSDVSLFLSGSWMGTLQGNAGFSYSALGTQFFAPETPLLFKQETDLTMSLWINNRWFVEANFLDDSEKNTYRAGYQGQDGEFVQYAGVGNTGLDFPSFPYLDLGGDSPYSFGYYGCMGSGGINVHTLFRYDAAVRDEKVFLGGRERTFSYVQLSNSIRGVSFVLPDTNIDSEIIVYIEDNKGSLRDSGGRRWRQATVSEYAAGKTQGLLELSTRPEGIVAVSYSKGASDRPWNVSMGSYSGSGFLSEVQQWFSYGRGVSLDNYPAPREILINGNYALVIREPGAFSPFERQNRYESPSSMSESAEFVRLSSGTAISGYQLVPLDISSASAEIPLYVVAVSKRNIYELLPAKSGLTQRSPETCWPLALEYPEIYLPGAQVFSGDAGLKFTNYGGSGSYQIGADVVPGSIQVWRSGILDANFSYNPSSGEVALNGPAGANELIRITYLKRSAETRLGSIASGIGAVYQKEGSPFSVQAAIGVRWNLTEDSSFSEEGVSSPGTAGLSAKTAWDYDNLKAQITAGFALDQNDTTGIYRAAGMEGHETILALPPETSFISNPPDTGLSTVNRANLIYRNYYSNSVIGSTLMSVDWNGAVVVHDLNKPYPVKDPQIKDTQSLAMEFTLNSAEKWTGFQTPVGYDADIISRAGEIEIPYRLYGFSQNTVSGFKLIVQIGALSGEDFAYNENPSLVWEQTLFSGDADVFDNSLRIARFTITETDRSSLAGSKYLRLIAVYDGIMEEVSGVVILSPPVVRGAAFRAVIFDGNTISGANGFSSMNNRVTALQIVDGGNTLEAEYGDTIKRLHTVDGTQRVLKIDWKDMETGISAGIDGRIGELPLSGYRALSFFVKGSANKNGTLSFVAADGPDSILHRQFEAHIPLGAFREGQWSKVTIRYAGSGTGITVDGAGVEGARFLYTPRAKLRDRHEGKSGYTAVLITPEQGTVLDDDSICIDEIVLEESALVYRINAGTAFEYSKKGTLLSVGGTQVLSDFLISTSVESEFRTDPVNDEPETEVSMAHRTGAEISVLGVKLNGNLSYTFAEDNFLWSADHGISREWELFSFKETFYASPGENNAKHGFSAAFSSLFYTKIDTGINYDYSGLERKWNLGLGVNTEREIIPSIDVSAGAAWAQDGKVEENENYADLWARTWRQTVPDSGKDAKGRKTSAKITVTEGTKPVGAVITLAGNVNSTKANSLTELEHSGFLDIPITLNKTAFNFRAGRLFKRQIYFYGSDVTQDGDKFFESINDFVPLWTTIPGYSLFADDINDVMDESLNNSPSLNITNYMAFNDHFSTRANFPSIYNLFAFVVPSAVSFRLERIMEQKLDTRSDMLNLAGGLGFSAVNMFGAFGCLPVFKFYQSDEFTHNIETAVIFPRNDDVSWRIQSAIGMAFRGFQGGALNLANTLTLRNKGLWLESAVADWTVPVKKSLIGFLYDWITAKTSASGSWFNLSSLLNSDYEHLRKESLELAFEQTEDNFRVMCSIGHEAIIRILGRLNLTGFVKIRFNEETKTKIFTVDGLLGTTLKVSF
ncbi:MAG: hypothetical protein LBV17_12255 [Treponema sp.]|jgi:hypothetical protein|nr:hypothetical protein [Treponema sp.]